MVLQTVWHARIPNDTGGIRREYDELQRIYYQTCQTMEVESALFKLGEDLRKIFLSEQVVMVEPLVIGGNSYPGYQLDTLTIWVDSQRYLPVRRENRDRETLLLMSLSTIRSMSRYQRRPFNSQSPRRRWPILISARDAHVVPVW